MGYRSVRQYCDSIQQEIQTALFWRDVASEMVATFFLMSVQCALPLSWGRLQGPDIPLAIQTGLGMGFIVATMAWTFGDFGGAHMNPAVTFAMVLALKITFLRGCFYVVAQMLGALAGAGFMYLVTPEEFQENLAATQLGPNVLWWQGMLTEAWITCILVLTIFGSTNIKRKSGNVFIPPFIIGLAVALCIMAAFISTGASMNPARSFGPAVVKGVWDKHWVYWAGPLLGAAVAALVYCAIFDKVDGIGRRGNRNSVYHVKTPEIPSHGEREHHNSGYVPDNNNVRDDFNTADL